MKVCTGSPQLRWLLVNTGTHWVQGIIGRGGVNLFLIDPNINCCPLSQKLPALIRFSQHHFSSLFVLHVRIQCQYKIHLKHTRCSVRVNWIQIVKLLCASAHVMCQSKNEKTRTIEYCWHFLSSLKPKRNPYKCTQLLPEVPTSQVCKKVFQQIKIFLNIDIYYIMSLRQLSVHT